MSSSEREKEGQPRNSGPSALSEKSSLQHRIHTYSCDKDEKSPRQRQEKRYQNRGRAVLSSGGGRGGNARVSSSGTASTQSSRRKSSSTRNIEVVTGDFEAMHMKCRAARYKVHKPGCSCSKVKQARSALSTKVENSTDGDVNVNSLDTSTEKLNGLVVLPEDAKNMFSVYLCVGTGVDEFKRAPLEAELKLKDEIFAQSRVDTATVSFKVSCAVCLLRDEPNGLRGEPNGFVCVSSSSRQTVDFVRDLARKRAKQKQQDGDLHADHAHFVCTAPRRALWQLCKAKTRAHKSQATNELMEHLGMQGVPTNTTDTSIGIELGHHLSSLLYITSRDSDADTAYWMTIVYDDTDRKKSPCWTFDLPGGKRHLGERSLEGAIRETEEETSLQIDGKWILEKDQPRKSSREDDSFNAFYMIGPPSDMLMGAMTDNPFWQSPGFCKDLES
jgi:hypothetical protein